MLFNVSYINLVAQSLPIFFRKLNARKIQISDFCHTQHSSALAGEAKKTALNFHFYDWLILSLSLLALELQRWGLWKKFQLSQLSYYLRSEIHVLVEPELLGETAMAVHFWIMSTDKKTLVCNRLSQLYIKSKSCGSLKLQYSPGLTVMTVETILP